MVCVQLHAAQRRTALPLCGACGLGARRRSDASHGALAEHSVVELDQQGTYARCLPLQPQDGRPIWLLPRRRLGTLLSRAAASSEGPTRAVAFGTAPADSRDQRNLCEVP